MHALPQDVQVLSAGLWQPCSPKDILAEPMHLFALKMHDGHCAAQLASSGGLHVCSHEPHSGRRDLQGTTLLRVRAAPSWGSWSAQGVPCKFMVQRLQQHLHRLSCLSSCWQQRLLQCSRQSVALIISKRQGFSQHLYQQATQPLLVPSWNTLTSLSPEQAQGVQHCGQ